MEEDLMTVRKALGLARATIRADRNDIAALLQEVKRLGDTLGWVQARLQKGQTEEALRLLQNTNPPFTSTEGGKQWWDAYVGPQEIP